MGFPGLVHVIAFTFIWRLRSSLAAPKAPLFGQGTVSLALILVTELEFAIPTLWA